MPDPRFFPGVEGGISLKQIAELINASVPSGADPERVYTSVASISKAGPEDIIYCGQKSFVEELRQTGAGLCVISPEFINDVPGKTVALVTDRPVIAYQKIVSVLHPEKRRELLIHPTAVIPSTAKVGANTAVGAYTVLGDHVEIGANCVIQSHCTISHALIGDHTVIYPGTRIGQDGFGYVFDKAIGRHTKIPQLGRVIIGNHVEIGANVTIDRGAMEDTVIGDNCIIDNLVQVAHNVKLGCGVTLISQSGIAGSSKLGNYAIVAAQGGVADHVTIGDKAQIGAKTGVMRDVPPNEKVLGTPAMPARQFMRQTALLQRMVNRKGKE